MPTSHNAVHRQVGGQFLSSNLLLSHHQPAYRLITLIVTTSLLTLLLLHGTSVTHGAQSSSPTTETAAIGESFAITNRAPYFLPDGSMAEFALNESTTIGSSVYTLRGRDPDGGRVHYYISGDTFTVNKDTGVVTLIRALDREREAILDVIITIVDDRQNGRGPNTVSLQREIRVLDHNDNRPTFQGATPYEVTISEATKPFAQIFEATITDADEGRNSRINVACGAESIPFRACEMFTLRTQNISPGVYKMFLYLQFMPLDYEIQNEFQLRLIASDEGGLESVTDLLIHVVDVQDEPPQFLNGPYAISVNENTPPGTSVLYIAVADGDATLETQRPVHLSITHDPKGYFSVVEKSPGMWMMTTSENPVDREDSDILLAGGQYQIHLQAVELVNNTETQDVSYSNVTITVNDINDQKPTFSMDGVDLTIPEDIANDTAIPNLNLFVFDKDVGENSVFHLVIEDIDLDNRATEAFSVFPATAMGRTPITLKVKNSNLLDYEMETRRQFAFNIVAVQGTTRTAARTVLHLSDTNDNEPFFPNDQYLMQIPEDAPSGETLFTLQAFDADSGEFGHLTYSLSGPGSEKFVVDQHAGHVSLAACGRQHCLDYEMQQAYEMVYEARDGGDQTATVRLYIDVTDVNDNDPIFRQTLFVRDVFENEATLEPPLMVHASDADGPTQGGAGNVRYYIKESNLTSLDVDPVTGEIRLNSPFPVVNETIVNNQRLKVNYQAVIVARDNGTPTRSSEARIIFHVKSERDGAPIFLNEPLTATVRENAAPGTPLLQIQATDPDGPDALLRYYLVDGSKDNFDIDSVTGRLKVSKQAELDVDQYGTVHRVVVGVSDANVPVPLESITTVMISVEDVNNKPPKFDSDTYVQYIPEGQIRGGEEILRVRATDKDQNAKIRYQLIVKEMRVRDKTGYEIDIKQAGVDKSLIIDSISGTITLTRNIDPSAVSVITFPIEATDIEAIGPRASQVDRAEVTIYIQHESGDNPIFSPPWTAARPNYEIEIAEEPVIGSTIMTISARDPRSGAPITKFEKIISSDPSNFVAVSPFSGIVTPNKRIDYEELPSHQIKFSVRAISANTANGASSVANVILKIRDVNDNSPVFTQESYSTSVLESAQYPHKLISVQASDRDSGDYGSVGYSISGDGAELFDIDEHSGLISVRSNVTLDRETKPLFNLLVTASDGHGRSSSVITTIKVLDVNDNAPIFSQDSYYSIVPENVPVGFILGSVKAVDPDEAHGGQVTYSFFETQDRWASTFFRIDSETGSLSVATTLSGKGREEPYEIYIKAKDNGRPSLESEVKFSVIIGDVSDNDGVPKFVRPSRNEVAYVMENSKPATFVYQVLAVDADNPAEPNGKVMYRFLQESSYFDINPVSGVITTALRPMLDIDREKQDNFTLILVAYDLGSPSQESHTLLTIKVNDTDDNEPFFDRPVYGPIRVTEVDEERPIGSVIGQFQAVDRDDGDNARIHYTIIYGNSDKTFDLVPSTDGSNVINLVNRKRIDRETQQEYRLVLKAENANKRRVRERSDPFQVIPGFEDSPPAPPQSPTSDVQYDPVDLSQLEILVKLRDVNDNSPKFERSRYISGVHYSLGLHSEIFLFRATDPDMADEKSKIEYRLAAITFIRGESVDTDFDGVFELNAHTGSLTNEASLRPYVGGHFLLEVVARSVPEQGDPHRMASMLNSFHSLSDAMVDESRTLATVFIVHDKDLVKFVFSRRPNEVQESLQDLKNTLSEQLPLANGARLEMSAFDTKYLERKDGSLDFESTSTCFQLIATDKIGGRSKTVSSSEALQYLNDESAAEELAHVYYNYSISSIESCSPVRGRSPVSSSELGVIVIALLIIPITFLLSCCANSVTNKLKRQMYSLGVGIHHPGSHPHSHHIHHISHTPIPRMMPNTPYGVPAPSLIGLSEQQRIYEWQESANQSDGISYRSVPIR